MSRPGPDTHAEWASDTDGLGTELLSGGIETETRSVAGARVVLLTLCALAVLIGVLYLVAAVLAGDKVPRGTSVAGVKIGGLSTAAAAARLQSGLAPLAGRPLQVSYDGNVRSVTPAQAGLHFDYYGTARAAGGQMSLAPGHLWNYWTGGDDLSPVVLVDDPLMQAALAKLATGVGLPVKEGAVHFRDGHVVPIYSQPGLGLDRVAAKKLMVAQFAKEQAGDPLRLPVTRAQPYITTAAVRDAIRRFGRPAMSAPVVLEFGSHKVVATPKRFSAALSMIPSGKGLVPVVNGRLLLASLAPVMHQFAAKPRSATIRLLHGRPDIVPARIGLTVNIGYLEQHFAAYAARGKGQRVMPVRAVLQEPKVTTRRARRLGVNSVVASYSVAGTRAQRNTLARAAAAINGTLVKPRATVRLAPLLSSIGSRSATGVQGGLNVLATGVFNLGLIAGYHDLGHRAAAVHIPGQIVGREVVIPAGSDVAFANTTSYAALVGADVSGRTLTLRLWSTRYWKVRSSTGPMTSYVASPVLFSQRPGCRPQTGQPGFSVTVTRREHHGATTRSDSYATTYRPTTTIRCIGGVTQGPGPGPKH